MKPTSTIKNILTGTPPNCVDGYFFSGILLDILVSIFPITKISRDGEFGKHDYLFQTVFPSIAIQIIPSSITTRHEVAQG